MAALSLDAAVNTPEQKLLKNIDATLAGGTALAAGETHVGEVGFPLTNPSANFNRVADTNAYASGDLVAQSTTAGSCTPLSWTAARTAAGSFSVRRARLKKSGTSITNAAFRLHLYLSSPTIANGDNAAWSTTHSGYLGAIDIVVDKAFTDGAAGNGMPNIGSDINVKLASGQTIYGLLEARGAYTPASGETFTTELELFQN